MSGGCEKSGRGQIYGRDWAIAGEVLCSGRGRHAPRSGVPRPWRSLQDRGQSGRRIAVYGRGRVKKRARCTSPLVSVDCVYHRLSVAYCNKPRSTPPPRHGMATGSCILIAVAQSACHRLQMLKLSPGRPQRRVHFTVFVKGCFVEIAHLSGKA